MGCWNIIFKNGLINLHLFPSKFNKYFVAIVMEYMAEIYCDLTCNITVVATCVTMEKQSGHLNEWDNWKLYTSNYGVDMTVLIQFLAFLLEAFCHVFRFVVRDTKLTSVVVSFPRILHSANPCSQLCINHAISAVSWKPNRIFIQIQRTKEGYAFAEFLQKCFILSRLYMYPWSRSI